MAKDKGFELMACLGLHKPGEFVTARHNIKTGTLMDVVGLQDFSFEEAVQSCLRNAKSHRYKTAAYKIYDCDKFDSRQKNGTTMVRVERIDDGYIAGWINGDGELQTMTA